MLSKTHYTSNKLQYSIFSLFLLLSVSSFSQHSFFNSFDNTKIAYTDEGKGKIVLLIHGFISNGSSWNRSALKKRLLEAGYRVIVPDLRGNGASDRPQETTAYANDAEIKDLIALADHLKLKKYRVVGYSRGSIVLAKLLTQEKRIGADLKILSYLQHHQPVTTVEELQQIKTKVLVIVGDEDKDNGDPVELQQQLRKSQLKIVKGDHNNTYKNEEFAEAILEFLK